jgi:predicted transcriptional regulator
MDADDAALEQITFLARSESRVRILTHLLESGSATTREFRTHLEASRSTVARSLNSLEERNWIESEAGEYRLTGVGTLVAEDFLDLSETIRTAGELSAFLRWFPLAEFDLELDQLRDADVTVYTGSDPYAPGRAQNEFVRSTDRFRAFLPAIDLEGAKLAHERIVNGELDAELVVTEEVEETVTSGEFARLFREKLETGRLSVQVAEDRLPFYLGLAADGRVQLGVEDDDGFPRALFESSSESIREWAERLYEDYRAGSRPKPLEAFE